MAMNTDIRISVSFKNHRKRKRLKLLLGEGATDYLLDLWIATAMNHPSGFLDGMDEIDIALEAGWDGDALEFCNALMECRFLEKDDSGVYFLHDWDDHQPHVVDSEERSERSRNAVNTRWEKYRKAKRIQSELSRNASGNNVENKADTNRIGDEYEVNTESNSPTYLPTYQPTKDINTPASASDAESSKAISDSPAVSPSGDGGARHCDGGSGKGKKDPFEAEIALYFKQFWTAYPLKKDKRAAEKAFMAVFKSAGKGRKALVLKNMEAHMCDYLDAVRDSDPKFIKHPATWLRAQDFLEPPPDPPDEKPKPEFVPYPLSPEEAEVERIANEKALKAFEERMKPGRRWIPEAKGDELPP